MCMEIANKILSHNSTLLPAEAIELDPDRVYPLRLGDYRRDLDIGVEEMA